MKLLQGVVSLVVALAFAGAVAAGAWWLATNKPETAKAEKPPPAASVTKVVKEEDLNTVTLTEEAEKRLGLKVGAVARKDVRRTRVYGGEVMVPAGKTITVVAPLGGTLKAPPGGVPQVGTTVKGGQPVLHLLPLLSPEGRATVSASLVDADGQVKSAQTQADVAKIALDRAKRVQREGAGSQRQVDEAQAAFDIASKTLDAALARRVTLSRIIGEDTNGTPTPLAIDAPEGGLLRTVAAMPGQTVPSGAALFEVVDLSTVWVRVAVPVGEVDALDRAAPAQVGKLAAAPGNRLVAAKPVVAPPSANPLAATVDVFYELPNADGGLTPGQRLGVTVPLAESQEALTVPWAAVVFDIHGGTWVYEQVGPRKFARRRVLVRYTAGADAVLAGGPAAGAAVVVNGTQELFGAETGFIK